MVGRSYFTVRVRVCFGRWGALIVDLGAAVVALYDYAATIDDEFDFQTGDIIGVADAPEDGWWSGELMDFTRREAGRHLFPSNFVRVL